jgi:hypothetical protein
MEITSKQIFWAIISILAVCGLYGTAVYLTLEPNHGLFGDMFGGLNTFFSGGALLGVVAALWQGQRQIQMQSEELGLQREELSAQRKELSRSAEAQELSQKVLKGQLRQMTIASCLELSTDIGKTTSGDDWERFDNARRALARSFIDQLEEMVAENS